MTDFGSIYQLANRPTVALQDPMESYGKAMQMKAAMQQQELGGMQLQQQRQAMADAQSFKELAQATGGDPVAMHQALLKSGRVELAAKLQKMQDESGEASAKRKKAAIEAMLGFNEQQLGVYSGVKDEESWQAAKPRLAANAKAFDQNIDTTKSGHPENYDPAFIASETNKLKSYKQRLEESAVSGFHPLDDRTVVGLTRQGEAKQILKDGVPVMAPKKEPLVQVNAGEKEAFKNETTLRKEYNSEIGSFKVVKDSMRRINVSEQNNTAGSDLNLIYAYMKMLDPNSAVKEGEFATAANAASLPNRLVAQYNKIVSGERLSPETKADFIKQANQIYEQALAGQKAVAGRYRGIAQKYGLDPASVVTDEDTKPALTKLHTNGKQTIGWNGSKWVDATTGQEVK